MANGIIKLNFLNFKTTKLLKLSKLKICES